jgi:uncharacterized protein YbaR (Trm112 family)
MRGSTNGWPKHRRCAELINIGSVAGYHSPMDTRLLELLVCPVTKGPLDYDREKQELTSRSARLAYPVRDGIPILLESEARPMSDDELGL